MAFLQSIIDPFTCGFAKVAAFHTLNDKHRLKQFENERDVLFKARVLRYQYDEFVNLFPTFYVQYDVFKRRFPAIIDNVRTLAKSDTAKRDHLFDVFSSKSFMELSEHKRSLHTLYDCKGCFENPKLKDALGYFPIKSAKLKSRAKKGNLFKARVLSDITNKIIAKLDEEYREEHQTTFTKQIESRYKESHLEKKTQKKTLAKQIITDIEGQWKETSLVR